MVVRMSAMGFVTVLGVMVGLCVSPAMAQGSASGDFPDRTFSVMRSGAGGPKTDTFAVEILPQTTGEWWVIADAVAGSYITVTVWRNDAGSLVLESSSRLRSGGEASAKILLTKGVAYRATFTPFGKAGTSVLRERFAWESVCGDGACNGAETCSTCLVDCASVYFEDDFSDNSAGWILGPEWQIGPAQASSCAVGWGNDPATDHSLSTDNGVAGVVARGCAAGHEHLYAYLESPPFDTSSANAGVFFTFYRWLNSDWPPFMTNDIEVWNGSQWVAVWTQPDDGLGIFDSLASGGPGWNPNQLDLTPYRNAAMKIRFGFKIEDPDVSSVGSWNIDDVLVTSC